MNTNEHIHERDLFWHKASQRPSSTGDYVATAIRSGRYKLIDFYMQNRIELYDIQKDPGETCNLVSQKPALTKELMLKIKEWRKQTGVTMANPQNMNHGDNKSKHYIWKIPD